MKTIHSFKKVVCFSVFAPAMMLSGCGDLAIVRPTASRVIANPTGAATVDVPITVDFTASTRARNIVLDGSLNITTAPAAGFVTTPGAGQQGWDQVVGKYPIAPGSHTLTASAEYLDWSSATQTVSKSVPFTVLPPLPDLWANGTATPATFNGSSNVDFGVFIHNLGPAAATNFSFTFYTNLPAGMNALSINSGFVCRGLSSGGQALQVECSGGSIAANQSAYMTVQVKPTNILSRGTVFTLYGYLNNPHLIQESDETNNTFTIPVTVGP